jgi:hypothetical protein
VDLQRPPLGHRQHRQRVRPNHVWTDQGHPRK